MEVCWLVILLCIEIFLMLLAQKAWAEATVSKGLSCPWNKPIGLSDPVWLSGVNPKELMWEMNHRKNF